MVGQRSDNTLRGARNLSFNKTNKDFLKGNDRVDFYKFTASSQIDFTLSLNGLKANADVKLLSANGAVLATANRAGKQSEQILKTLDTGIYYVQIQLKGKGQTQYKLRASATITEPGETPATARNIGLLSGTFTTQEVVKPSDEIDYYKFQISNISSLDFRVTGAFTGLGPNSYLFFDENGNGNLDTFEEGVLDYIPVGNQQVLFPGTYFVRISNAGYEDRYNLSLAITPTPANISSDPGSNSTSAFDLTPFLSTGSFTAKEAVGIYDNYDVYKFTITQPRTFISTVNYSPSSVNAYIGLRDDVNGTYSPGDRYFVAALGSNYPRRLLPGTYYISVSTANNVHTRYELSINLN